MLFDQESIRSGRTVVTNGFAASHGRVEGKEPEALHVERV